MKNKIYTVFLLSIVFLSCAEKDIKYQNSNHFFRGKVKQLSFSILATDSTGFNNKSKMIALFDKKGNQTLETSYSNDGATEKKDVYSYSKNEGEIKTFRGDTLEGITNIKYDKNGYLQESTRTYLKDEKKYKIVFKNNNIGLPIEMIREDGDKDIMEYDKNGDLIQTTSFVSGIIKNEIKEYDKTGNWTKQIFHYKGMTIVMDRQIEYYE